MMKIHMDRVQLRISGFELEASIYPWVVHLQREMDVGVTLGMQRSFCLPGRKEMQIRIKYTMISNIILFSL